MNHKNVSRRTFIKHLVYFPFVFLKLSGSSPPPEVLDPPFICLDPCRTPVNKLSSSTSPPEIRLIFSGYNSESSFWGYNIRYGKKKEDLAQDHKDKKTNFVLNFSKSNILDINNIGTGPFPSYFTSRTLSSTQFVSIRIMNTQTEHVICVSAYNAQDKIESSLSNFLNIG